MKDILSKIKLPGISPVMDLGEGLFSKVLGTMESGVGVLKSTLGGIRLFGATATSKDYDYEEVDEKHYFLIPDINSEQGYALYVLRCLPKGVPPINELPKRRLLHLSSEHARPMLREILLNQARETVKDTPKEDNFISDNLKNIIDEIDEVDDKAFNGVLLVGGLIALVNPLAGAAVAMNAIVPSVGLILSKYGLKLASDTATNIDVAQKIRKAEKEVKQQFKEANTVQLINPLLLNLTEAGEIENWLMEPEKFKFDCENFDLSKADTIRLLDLTRQAISDVTDGGVPDAYYKKISNMVLWGFEES